MQKLIILPLLWITFSFSQGTNLTSKKPSKNDKDEVLEELEFFNKNLDISLSSSNQKNKEKIILDDTSKKEMLKNQTDKKTLKMLNEQYKKGKKYSDQLQILDLLIPQLPQDISLKLDRIKAQKMLYYYPYPTLKKKLELKKQLEAIIKNHPNHQEAYWSLWDLNDYYVKWSQNTEFYDKNFVLQNLELIKVIQERFGENSQSVKYLCQYLVLNHLYNEAPQACQKAKTLNSEDPETLIYADYLLKKQDQKSLLKILKKFPRSLEAHIVTGDLFLDQKKYSLSHKYFKKALSLQPDHLLALIGVAESLFYNDKPEKALQYYVKSCGLSVLRTRSLFQKAKSILNQKNLFKIADRYQYQINLCINEGDKAFFKI